MDVLSSQLKPDIGSVHWAELSRSQRKVQWLRLCSITVKQSERLVVELETQPKTEEKTPHYVEAVGPQWDRSSLPVESRADSHVKVLASKRQNRRNRARRLSANATRTGKQSTEATSVSGEHPARTFETHSANRRVREQQSRHRAKLTGTSIPGKIRKVTVNLPPVDFRVRHIKQPSFRIRRLAISEAVEQKRLAARLAAITERTKQHTKRQELRSRRRMQTVCTRMEWQRRSQEKTTAGDELWQYTQEAQRSTTPQDDLWAWPRLAQRQRDLLANEVQAFVRGSR